MRSGVKVKSVYVAGPLVQFGSGPFRSLSFRPKMFGRPFGLLQDPILRWPRNAAVRPWQRKSDLPKAPARISADSRDQPHAS